MVSGKVGETDGDAVRAMAVGLMAETILRGWMRPETLGEAWDTTPWESVRYLTEEWAVRERAGQNPIDLCWLVATREGLERGISLGEGDGWVYRWMGRPFEAGGRFVRNK
jgi:hypothetical protein